MRDGLACYPQEGCGERNCGNRMGCSVDRSVSDPYNVHFGGGDCVSVGGAYHCGAETMSYEDFERMILASDPANPDDMQHDFTLFAPQYGTLCLTHCMFQGA